MKSKLRRILDLILWGSLSALLIGITLAASLSSNNLN